MLAAAIVVAASARASNLTAFLGAWAKIDSGAACNATDPWATGGGGYFPNPTTLGLPSNTTNAPPGKWQLNLAFLARKSDYVWQSVYPIVAGRLLEHPSAPLYVDVTRSASTFGNVVEVTVTVCDYYVETNRSETQLYRSCGPSLVNLTFPVSCNTSDYGVNRLCNCTTGVLRPSENDTCTETCDCLSAAYSYAETTQSPVAAPTTVPTTSPTAAPTIGLGNGSGVITCADSFSSNPSVCATPTVVDYRGPDLRCVLLMTPTGGDPAYTLTVNTGDLSGDVEPACNCSELASQINAKNSELTVTCLYGFLVETSESTTAPLVTSLPGCNVLDTADPTERCRYVPGPGWCTVDDYWKVADWSVSGLYDDSTAWVPGGVPAIDEEIASELAGIVSGSIPETGLTDPCLCDAYRQPFWTNEATLVRVRTLATTAAPTDVPTGVPTVSTTPAPSSAAPTFATAAAAVPYTMYMCQLGDPTVAYGVCSSDATANAGTVYCGNNVGFPSCAWNIPCTGGHIIGTGDVDTTTMGCGTADNTPVLRSNYVDLTDVECFDENGVCPTTGTGYAVCWNTATQTPLMSYCNPTETSRGDQCTATYPCDGVNELLFRDRGGVWPWPELIGGLRYGSACGWGSGSSPPTSSAPTSAAPTVASPTVSLSPTAPPGLRLWDSPDAQSRDFWPAKETTASFLWQYGGIGPLLFADVRDGLLVSLLSAGDALDVNLTQALRPGDACSGVSGCGSVAGRVTVPFATADENDLITDDDTVGYTNYSVSVCRWIWVSFSYGSGDFAPVIVLNIPGTSSVDTLPALFGAAFVNTGYLDRVVGTPAWTTTLGKIRAVNASVAESIVTRVWWTPWVNVSADNDTDTCGGVAGAGLVPTLDYYPSFDDYRASLDDWCGLVLNSTTSALSAFVGDGPRLFPRLYIDSTLAGTEPLAVTFTTGSAEQLDDWVVSLYSLALTGGSNGVRTDNRTSGAVLVTPPGLVVNTSGASYAPLVWFSVSSEPENASAACTSYNGHVAGCNDVPIEDCATVPLCAPRTATTTPSTTTSAGFYTATLPPTRPPSPGPAFVEIDQGAMLATVGVAVVIVCLLLLLSAVLVCHSRLNGREVPDDEHTLLGMDDT